MPQAGFMKMMADKTRDVETEDGIIEAFQVFDKDGKGTCLSLACDRRCLIVMLMSRCIAR